MHKIIKQILNRQHGIIITTYHFLCEMWEERKLAAAVFISIFISINYAQIFLITIVLDKLH